MPDNKKERLHYIDITKGILIMMLVYHHIVYYGMYVFKIDNIVLDFMSATQNALIVCYFMPAFFFITGICSNYNKDYKSFFITQIKTLVLPAIVFVIINWFIYSRSLHGLIHDLFYLFYDGGGCWFLITLFLSKLIYFISLKFIHNKHYLLILFVMLSFLSAIINNFDSIPNILVHKHVFDLSVFLVIGNLYKEHISSKKIALSSILIYSIITTVYILQKYSYPIVTHGFYTYPNNWIIHILLSITGSIIILYLCKTINTEKLLEYIGRNTIVIYLSQGFILRMFFGIYHSYLSTCNLTNSIVAICSILISTIGIGLFISYIIKNSIFKVLLGNF